MGRRERVVICKSRIGSGEMASSDEDEKYASDDSVAGESQLEGREEEGGRGEMVRFGEEERKWMFW